MGFDLLLAGGPDNPLFADDLLACLVEVRVEQSLDQPTRFAVRFQDDIENGALIKAGLPELQIGDLVLGRVMGRYTACSATDFNFIPRARIVALNVQARSQHAD